MTTAITIGLLVTSSHNWSLTLWQWTRQSRILTRQKDRPLRSVTGNLSQFCKDDNYIFWKVNVYAYVCAIVIVSAYLCSCLRISQGLLTVEAPVAGSLLSSLVKWDRWRGKAKPKAFVCINTERKDVEIQKSYDTKYETHNNATRKKVRSMTEEMQFKTLLCTNSQTGDILGNLHSTISLVYFDSHLKMVFVEMWILIRSSKMKKEEKAKVRQWSPLSQWRSPAESVGHEL